MMQQENGANLVYIDRTKFDEIFNQPFNITQPDAWKRVAAYQYNITYGQVTAEQRRTMKSMYFAYLYSHPNPTIFMQAIKFIETTKTNTTNSLGPCGIPSYQRDKFKTWKGGPR